ncbi:hypothetical protein [Brucella sp. 22210]|uniref:hypothetical protein n=1 Tax=Brucella sp. 22210 TaxID=3453892 RepID=UPI003F8535F7
MDNMNIQASDEAMESSQYFAKRRQRLSQPIMAPSENWTLRDLAQDDKHYRAFRAIHNRYRTLQRLQSFWGLCRNLDHAPGWKKPSRASSQSVYDRRDPLPPKRLRPIE